MSQNENPSGARIVPKSLWSFPIPFPEVYIIYDKNYSFLVHDCIFYPRLVEIKILMSLRNGSIGSGKSMQFLSDNEKIEIL